MAAALPWIGIALSAAGIGVGVAGSIQSGRAQKAQAEYEAESSQAMAEYNARVQDAEAKAQQQATEYEQMQQAREASRRMGAMRADLGASGVVATEGTPLLIQATQAEEDELENLMIGYAGQTAVSRTKSQAALDRLQGSIYAGRGKMAKMYSTAGYISAASTGLQGAGRAILTGFDISKSSNIIRTRSPEAARVR
jgi:pyruvate/2-oxoglutarate dehydrogenase complex dihydrolipoamide acyltransferase (E2) component